MITKRYLRKLKKVNFKRKYGVKINGSNHVIPNQRRITLYKEDEFYYTEEPNSKNGYDEKEWVGIYEPVLLKFYDEEK